MLLPSLHSVIKHTAQSWHFRNSCKWQPLLPSLDQGPQVAELHTALAPGAGSLPVSRLPRSYSHALTITCSLRISAHSLGLLCSYKARSHLGFLQMVSQREQERRGPCSLWRRRQIITKETGEQSGHFGCRQMQ